MKALYPGADFSGVPVSSSSNESNNFQAGGKITIHAGGTGGSIGTIEYQLRSHSLMDLTDCPLKIELF